MSDKYKITVCTNISCMLRDSDAIVNHLQTKLGVGFNEVTADGKFCLKEGECMGACGGAPLMTVNNHTMHEFLTPEKVDEILQIWKKELEIMTKAPPKLRKNYRKSSLKLLKKRLKKS